MALETLAGEESIKESIERFLVVLSVSLSVATLPRVFSWVREIPYTLLLVIVGLGLAFVDVRLVNLSPELILLIFLPPLLFEAAWNLHWKDLKQNLVPVSLYAILGVAISVLGIAWALSTFTLLPLSAALLLGASLSATDPISVIALFRELGVSQRLSVVMEGESLFNDGVAVVSFTLLVGLALGAEQFEVQQAIAQFGAFVGIGIGVGSLIGFGISYLTQRFDLPFVEQSLTLVSAYGTYLVAEELGGSGVIAVVIVGVILGNFGSRIGMNPRTRAIVSEFWDFLAFFVNSIVFLLIGDQIQFADLAANLTPIAIAVAAMLITRAIAIYGLGALSNWLAGSEIGLPQQTVLWWGGLRGSVSIALALSVPIILEAREEIIATVFGVVLFTLLVQGLTVKPLLFFLNLLGEQKSEAQYLEAIARRQALLRVLDYLQKTGDRPEIAPDFYQSQTNFIQEQLQSLDKEIETLRSDQPRLQDFVRERFQQELQNIEANTYAELLRAGRLNQALSPLLQELPEESKG